MQRTPAPSPVPSVTDRFARIIDAACKAVGEAQNRGLPGPVAGLIWSYLMRLKRRFTRLAERALAGTLQPPRPRKPPEMTGTEIAPEKPRRNQRRKPLIRTWGWRWIARRAQYTDVYGGHLAMLLENPEMIRLLGLDRRFTTMLRPLAMGLGTHLITPDRLGKPLAPARPARRDPTAPRPPRKPRARKITWKCARPPRWGLIFSDPSLNVWPS